MLAQLEGASGIPELIPRSFRLARVGYVLRDLLPEVGRATERFQKG